jgi:hypothetical protein
MSTNTLPTGMTLSAPIDFPATTVIPAPPTSDTKMYIAMTQLVVPQNGNNNIATLSLLTGTSSTPNVNLAYASAQYDQSHSDYIPCNSATIPVPGLQTCDWSYNLAGDGASANPTAYYFEVTFPETVYAPTQFNADSDIPQINGAVWSAPSDGMLVGQVVGDTAVTSLTVSVLPASGPAYDIASASQINGTDVYVGLNSFCVPVSAGTDIKVVWSDINGFDGATAELFWLAFDNTVFTGGYIARETGITYQNGDKDLFVIANASVADSDNSNMQISGSFGSSSGLKQYVSSSVNNGNNRWLLSNSFLMPVPKNNSFRVDSATISGTPQPGATVYTLEVIAP